MKNLSKQSHRSGKLLIKENELTRKLYILKKGKVRVFKTYMGGKITLAVLNQGEIFGELSFFDSKPRSASVETLTDVVVECIDGDDLKDEIGSLPAWVHLIFRSVADRFRVIDQKMTMLESLNQFQRKTLSSGNVGNAIYVELMRYLKILKLLLNENDNDFTKDVIVQKLSEVMGKNYIDPKAFLRVLYDFDFISYEHFENTNRYMFVMSEIDLLETFLRKEYEEDKCTLLSTFEVTALRMILSHVKLEDNIEKLALIQVPEESIEYHEDQNMEKAFESLLKRKLLIKKSDKVFVSPDTLIKLYRYYSMVKSFDHTIMYE